MVTPRLLEVANSAGFPFCASISHVKTMKKRGFLADLSHPKTQLFTEFVTYPTAADAWSGYAHKFLKESEYETFVKKAYPRIGSSPGALASYCESHLHNKDHENSVELKKRLLWTAEDLQTLMEAVEVFGRKWSVIRDQFFPTRTPTAIKQRYLDTLRTSDALTPPALMIRDPWSKYH